MNSLFIKPAAAKQCIDYMATHLNINYETDLIINPLAGNGAFIIGMESLVRNSLWYDPLPAHPQVNKLDFLAADFTQFDATVLAGLWYDDIHVLSCPPFAKATEYMTHASKFARTISVVLPADHPIYEMPDNYRQIFSAALPSDSFTLLMAEHPVETVFQIWLKT